MVVLPGPRGGARGAAPGPRRAGLFSTGGWTWRHWLALGACFALGHGLAERLLKLRPSDGPAGATNFAVQPFPGQSLEALRRRHGGPVLPLRADLDALEQDKRMAREKREAEERRGELEARLRAEQELAREQAEQSRLEALDQREGGATPSLPPPASAPLSPVADPPAAGPTLPELPQAPPPPSPGGTP